MKKVAQKVDRTQRFLYGAVVAAVVLIGVVGTVAVLQNDPELPVQGGQVAIKDPDKVAVCDAFRLIPYEEPDEGLANWASGTDALASLPPGELADEVNTFVEADATYRAVLLTDATAQSPEWDTARVNLDAVCTAFYSATVTVAPSVPGVESTVPQTFVTDPAGTPSVVPLPVVPPQG